jgi:alkanesulfonate monooxygenase SsuD/methylene tetrahydromethanopterin reductase-like flavin-dependent oxidoreductase (luciferase family)
METTTDGLVGRFTRSLETLAGMLGGTEAGLLVGDAAIANCRHHPVPMVSAAAGLTAARRAARRGVGLLLDSLSMPQRCRQLVDSYRADGGAGTCILIRRAWVGRAPREWIERQVDVYRSYAPAGATANWQADGLIQAADGREVAEQLADVVRRAGADALNLRVHAPGVSPEQAREQISLLGDGVLPLVRAALGWPRQLT